jgi:deazaflavin-dependent oxidoreductase (nitroreductase family)
MRLLARLVNNLHPWLYRLTGGRVGGKLYGVDVLVLTTIGRRSGKPRSSALLYGRDGQNLVVIASKGGSPRHPSWYVNLRRHPEATVQIGKDVFKVRARDATPEERPRMWETMTRLYPAYDDYQKKTSRQIPVVVLEPVELDENPPPQSARQEVGSAGR